MQRRLLCRGQRHDEQMPGMHTIMAAAIMSALAGSFVNFSCTSTIIADTRKEWEG